MDEAIVQGVFTGLVLSTFMGPIFFLLIDLGINSSIKAVAYLALGTFVSDLLTVVFIYFVAAKLISHNQHIEALYIAGGSVLIFIGIGNILKKAKAGGVHEPDQKSLMKIFAKAFVINSTNPNVFIFWFGAVMVAVNTYRNNSSLVLAHFMSALLVVLSTDFLKGYSASLLKRYITTNRLKVLNFVSGLILIYFGVKLMFFH